VAVLTWNGAVSGDWDTNTANWTIAGGTTNFNPGYWVTFDDTLTGATNVVLSSVLIPGSMMFNNSISNYVISGSGKLSGTTDLLKIGSGTVTLTETGGDDFSGGINVTNGMLILDNASPALTGTTIIGGNGTLQVGNNDANGGLPSGGVTNNGTLVFNQATDATAGNVFTGAGTFVQNGTNTLTLTAPNLYKGRTLVNAGTLALSGNGSIAASTNINLAAGAAINVTNRLDGLLTLTNGQTLQGNGTVIGFLASLLGATIMPGTNAASIGALAVSNNVTLLGTLQLKVDAGNNTNDTFTANAFTYGGALVVTNLSATPLSLGASFTIFTGTNYTGAFSSVLPVAAGPRLVWNTNRLTVDGTLVVGYPAGDTWDGTVNGNWDTTTTNWWNSANETNFSLGDPVTFDDTLTGTTNVTFAATATPVSVLFNNSQSNYTFSGSGKLSGITGINKFGTGTVTFTETGGDDFTGGLRVNSGTLVLDWANALCSGGTFIASGANVRVGQNDANGSLPSGNLTNNGTLLLNRSVNFTLANVIFGPGALIQSNANITTLSANNLNWNGKAIVAQGTLRLGVVNALGSGTNVLIIVSNNATLDVNGVAGTNTVTATGGGVGGLGAVVNNSLTTQAFPALAFLTLAGNTTIGGTNRWDLRPASASPDTLSPTFAGLSTGGQAYSLTKVGTNFIGIVSATVDASLASVNIQAGTLDLEGSLTGMGNTNNPITVFTNATLEFWSLSSQLNKPIFLNDGATIFNGSGANTLNSSLVLALNTPAGKANCTFNIAGSYLWTLKPISGPGSLIKTGSSILYVNVTNTYQGATLIKAGTLELYNNGALTGSSNINVSAGATFSAAGRSDDTVQLVSGQFMQGSGTVSAIVNAAAGSTVMPGTNATAIATLTISSNAIFHGTCLMKLNPANLTSDAIHAAGVTYGGTLSLTNVSATPLSAGNSFHLFTANSYAGAFTTITPAIPGIGLAWSTNALTSGILNVVLLAKPILNGISLSGTNLVFNGTNAVAGRTYIVLTTTNLIQPLNQWLPVATNVPSVSGNFTFTATNAFNASSAQQFYLLQAQ
jgi:autotransporter-associated beta strand protein